MTRHLTTTNTIPATPFCSCLPTPSSRLSSSRAFPTRTSSWLHWGAGLPWTFSPLLSKIDLFPNLTSWLKAFSTGGRASMSLVRLLLVGPLKVYLNLIVPGSPDVRPALRMVALEFIFVPVFPLLHTTVSAHTTSCITAFTFLVFASLSSL